MDPAIAHLFQDSTQDWKWPELFIMRGQNKERHALSLATQMGQDFGKHPTLVCGTHVIDIDQKAVEPDQTGLIAELFRRTDIMRFDCRSNYNARTLLKKGGIVCFGGVTLFRGSQKGGYELCDTTSKLDVILPYVPSGVVTTDTAPQIEKSLQVAIEDARKAKATILIIVGYNFKGLNMRSEWQQQSADEFARILLYVLLQDMSQHGDSPFELISIVVDDQTDHEFYTMMFRDWTERNIRDSHKDVSEEHDDQSLGVSHVRSATDSSMASAGVDAMSISSAQEAVAFESQPQRLLEWLKPQSKEEDLSIVLYEEAYGIGAWNQATEVLMVDPDSLSQGVLKYIEKKLRDLYRWQKNWDACPLEHTAGRASRGQCRMVTGTS